MAAPTVALISQSSTLSQQELQDDTSFAIQVNGVPLSDFITPNYGNGTSGPYDVANRLTAPREVAINGYISWIDEQQDVWKQATNFAWADELRRASSSSRGCSTSECRWSGSSSNARRSSAMRWNARDRTSATRWNGSGARAAARRARARTRAARRARGRRSVRLRQRLAQLVEVLERLLVGACGVAAQRDECGRHFLVAAPCTGAEVAAERFESVVGFVQPLLEAGDRLLDLAASRCRCRATHARARTPCDERVVVLLADLRAAGIASPCWTG